MPAYPIKQLGRILMVNNKVRKLRERKYMLLKKKTPVVLNFLRKKQSREVAEEKVETQVRCCNFSTQDF